MPSESQWEVACRAEEVSPADEPKSPPFHFGATLDPSWARYDANDTYGRGRRGDDKKRPVPIGFFGLVNRWGLAEMHGELQEWCTDQWHRDPVSGAPGDGSALEGPDPGLAEVPREQEMKMLRGGSWINDPHNARAAMRNSNHPDNLNTTVGVGPGCFPPPQHPGAMGGPRLPRPPEGRVAHHLQPASQRRRLQAMGSAAPDGPTPGRSWLSPPSARRTRPAGRQGL